MAIKATQVAHRMINSRPRFGLEGDKLFEYSSSRYIPAHGFLNTPEGRWDLQKVAECIRNNHFIEVALDRGSSSGGERNKDAMAKQAEINAALVKENSDLVETVANKNRELAAMNDEIKSLRAVAFKEEQAEGGEDPAA